MAESGGERPTKKLRLSGIFVPFVPSGAFAASKSASVGDYEHFAKIKLREVSDDSIFFPESVTRLLDDIKLGDGVRHTLRKAGRENEDWFRNAVFTELLRNHGIKFPASSEHRTFFRRLRSRFSWHNRYKETDVASLLYEFHKQREGDGSEDNDLVMARLLLGLNVTTTSLPDMTVLRDKYLYFGEFKNSPQFTPASAAKQCTLYLYALLYYFRVRLGLDVKAVFGFWVCGPACFAGRDEYAVGFVRLSAPTHLGGSIVPDVYKAYHSIDSVDGIQELIRYLRFGRIIDVDESKAAVAKENRIPALLSLPGGLWKSPLLVTNGTASMVFKGTGEEIIDLLSDFDRDSELFDDFILSAKSYLESASGTAFYLKIRLRDTSLRACPASTVLVIRKKHKDSMEKLYPITPAGDEECGIFLMNDCGDSLESSKEFQTLRFSEFCTCFKDLWSNAVAVSEGFLHGDVLPHNMVYNEKTGKLVLIDADEGTVSADAPKRVLENDAGAVTYEYAYLRYPNFLRNWRNRKLYTEVQLVASFLLLAQLFQQNDEEQGKIAQLQEEVTEISSFLSCNNNEDPSKACNDMVASKVRVPIELAEEILGVE